MREAREELDRIRLTGITATGHHGVFPDERRDGQTFVADVVLHVDTRPAAAADRLDLTVHYGVLAEQVAGVLAGEAADLVETVAERVAAVALTHQTVVAVDVTVHKPEAPVPVPFGDVAVEIHRDRTHRRPVVAAPPVVVDEGAPDVPVAPVPADEGRARHAAPAEAFGPEASGPDPLATGPVAAGALAGPLTTPGPVAATGPATGALPLGEVVPDAGPVDRLDAAPAEPVEVVLALGSNVGASRDVLRAAIRELDAVDGLEVTQVAPLARTQAVGPEQPDFLNTVVLARTTLAPRALLAVCHEIEALHGRERAERWGPRTLDIDIVVHGSTVAVADDLELPHPRAHERAFVLEPWAQVAPDAVLPGLGGGPVADLARTAPDRDGIRWMALDWWQGTEAAR